MSKPDKKKANAANAVDITSKLRAFEATFKAACFKGGVAPNKALLQVLQQHQEDAVPLKRLLLTGQGVDGPSLRAVAAGLAAYPEVVRCSLWRTNVGDEGLLALSQLLRASTTPAWRGSKLQHLELMGDGQPDSATPNEWVVAKAAAAAAAAAPPAKPSKKAAAGGGASGGGAAATAAAGEGQGGEAGAAAAAAAGGGGGTVGGDSGTSVTPGTPGAGGPTLTSSSSGSGGRGLPCSSSSCDLYATGGSGGGSTWGGGGATGRLGGTLRPSTAPAGGRRTTIIPQALDFPLQLTLAQCSLRSRSSDAESLRAGISSLRTSLELRRADMVKTFDSWQEDQSSKGMIPVCRLGVLEPVVVAGVAVSNPLLNGGYKRYPAPLEEQQEYKQYYQHALVHAPPASPQQQQQQQQQQPPPPPQKQRPQFTPPALQSFALALGVSGLVLTSLVLDHTHLGDTGLSHLLPGLQRCSSLKVLSLQYCGLGPSAASTLSSVLAAGPSVNTGTYSKGYSVGNKAAAAAAAAAAAGGVSGDGSSYGGGTYGDAVPVLELPGHVQYSQTPAGAPSSRLAVGSSSITGEPGSTFLLGSTIPEGRGDWVNPSSSTVKDSAAANQASSSSSSRTPKLEVLQLSGNHLTGVGLSQLAPAIRRSQELKVLGLSDVGVAPGDTIGLQQLLGALAGGCPDLQQLDLDLNYLGDRGASLLLPLLSCKPQLQLTKVCPRVSRELTVALVDGMSRNKPAKKGRKRK